MLDISVTSDESNSARFISVILDISENISWQLVKGSFHINSIKLFFSSKLTLESIWSISLPLTNILSGSGLKDSFKIYCIPFSPTLIAIFELISAFLTSFGDWDDMEIQYIVIFLLQ